MENQRYSHSSSVKSILPLLYNTSDFLLESPTLRQIKLSSQISQSQPTNYSSQSFTSQLLSNIQSSPTQLLSDSGQIQQISSISQKDTTRQKISQISSHTQFLHSNNDSNFESTSPPNQYQKYRDIVNDMTTDLVDLINQVQNQFDENDIVMAEDNSIEFESNLHELETQNDLLQDAIKMLQLKNTQSEITFNSILEHKEDQYKSRIKSLEYEVEQSNNKYNALNRKHQALLYDVKQYKDKCKCGAVKAIEVDAIDKETLSTVTGSRKGQDLQHIFEMMERKDDELKVLKEFSTNEKARLNKRIADTEDQIKEYEVHIAVLKTNLEKKDSELKDLRRAFAEQNDDTQLRDIIEKLTLELSEEKTQRKASETTLEAKIKGLEKALDDTRSSLFKANDSLATLEAQSANYQKQSIAAIKENETLREELFTLKGDIASLEGTERSLKSQLSKTQEEVQTLRTANVKIKTLAEDLDNFKQNCVRLKHTNFELIAKYNSLIEDYNILADEFRKLSELKEIIEKELDIFRKWQEDQVEQDSVIKAYIQNLTEHIETLSGDRDELIQKIYDYHQDLLIVSSELDHYKEIFADTMGEAHDRASLAAGELPGQDSADAIIRKILRTAEKLSHTRKTFQESLDRRNSK